MTVKFNWGHIKNGFRGFENLAYDYVDKEYPSGGSWIKTQETRDGNKDAYAIVVGYRDQLIQKDQWWMEAKYSEEKKRLPRYRLDATIVSAILEGNVTKVIFVTNIIIDSKTILDIKRALETATNCREVHFCTKQYLEVWLKNNNDIAKNYFELEEIDKITVTESFLIDGIDIYSESNRALTFCEPLLTVETNKVYSFYFSIYSPTSTVGLFALDDRYKGIKLLSDDNITLRQGENHIQFKFSIPSKFISRTNIIEDIVCKLDETPIHCNSKVVITDSKNLELKIESQICALTIITDKYKNFLKMKKPQVHIIKGESYVGKSHTVNHFLSDNQNEISYSVKLVSNPVENSQLISRLILFILFPYINPQSIDSEFINKLGETKYISNFILDLVYNINSEENTLKLISNLEENLNIFPLDSSINQRLLVIDDFQKADRNVQLFIYKLVNEIYEKNIPVFIVIIGWNYVFDIDIYSEFARNKVITEHDIKINLGDLTNYLRDGNLLPFSIDSNQFKHVFGNLAEMLAFIQYIENVNRTIDNPSELQLAVKSFAASEFFEEQVITRFSSLNRDISANELCNRIYYSLSGVDYNNLSDHEQLSANKLLQLNLVKGDVISSLVPFHDLYTYIYRKKYNKLHNNNESGNQNNYESLFTSLLFDSDRSDLVNSLNEIKFLFENKKFYTIYYILHNLFSNIDKKILIQRYGEYQYYELRYIYAHSVTNQSRIQSGAPIFEEIFSEIHDSGNIKLYPICADALFERINSQFERLQFKEALNYINILNEILATMKLSGLIDNDLNKSEKYILSKSIEMLINSELEEPDSSELYNELSLITDKYNYLYENAIFDLRYSETQYYHKTSDTYKLTELAKDKLYERFGEGEKFYMWAEMDYIFLRIILNMDSKLILDLVDVHEKLKKDYFNDYRKRIYVIASLYYSKGLINEGNRLLFSDELSIRELRPRQKGFYHCTHALHDALMGEIKGALVALDLARDLFNHIPSYCTIIDHNKEILLNNLFDNKKIEFCINGNIKKGYYHIDPRCIW